MTPSPCRRSPFTLAARFTAVFLLALPWISAPEEVEGQTRLATPIPATLPSGDPAPRSPEAYQALARELLAELVGINTTASVGDNTRASEAMRDRLLAAGFPEDELFVIVPGPRKGNLVARLRGRNPELKPILLLAHIDVVEADPADWTLPPFELIEQDGVFYGRGTADNKDEAAIYVANLIRMWEEGFVPERDIVVALTADEEGGGTNGVVHLLREHRELVDAAFVFNEGGGGILDEDGRRLSNTVQAAEKKYQNIRIEATNPGGHSSLPRPDNAIVDLARALVRVGEYHFPVRLNEVTRLYLERSAEFEDPRTAAAMRALLANEQDAEAAQVLSENTRLNSMLRTTCVATLLEGGHAANALPQRAVGNVNCRILPDESPDDIRRQLEEVVANPGVDVYLQGRAQDSPPSPITEEILSAVERITEEMWPGVPVIPTMSTGATDGLYFRNAGIPVYGLSGLFYGDSGSHGMNERIPVQSFYEGQEFLYRLVKLLATGPVS